MIMLLYDMKFGIISFDMIEPSSSVLFFPMCFLVSINDGAKIQILSHFLLLKVCNRLKLNDLFFSLERGLFLTKYCIVTWGGEVVAKLLILMVG